MTTRKTPKNRDENWIERVNDNVERKGAGSARWTYARKRKPFLVHESQTGAEALKQQLCLRICLRRSSTVVTITTHVPLRDVQKHQQQLGRS